MRIGGMCFNWRVVAGVAVLALALWLVAPGWFVPALPVLAVAICPLSMLLMLRGTRGVSAPSSTVARATVLHDAVRSPEALAATSQGDLAALQARLATLRAEQQGLQNVLAQLRLPPQEDAIASVADADARN